MALTVGELRKKLEGIPDELEVRLGSDTGVDQGEGEIVVEDAWRTKYDLPEGQTFEDGSTGVDYFTIYANDRDEDDAGTDEDDTDGDNTGADEQCGVDLLDPNIASLYAALYGPNEK